MRGTFNLASVPLIISFSIASLFLKGKKIEILTQGLNISIYSLFTCYCRQLFDHEDLASASRCFHLVDLDSW